MGKKTKETDAALEKWEAAKAKGRPLHEHLANLIKAAIGLPRVGGVLASLMSDYLPNARADRLEEFAEAERPCR